MDDRSHTSVEIFRTSAPEDWNDVVIHLGGNIFHSTYWADYQSDIESCEPVYLLARDADGEAIAGATAFNRKSPHPILSLLFRSIDLPTYPYGGQRQPEAKVQLIREVEAFARESGCARMTVGSFMSGQSELALSDLGYSKRQKRIEFVVDLTDDLDSLWTGIKKDQRDRIKRLERRGIALVEGGDLQDLYELKGVRETARDRRSEQGQVLDLPADDAFYDRLHRCLMKPGVARLFLARDGTETIAAILFTVFAGKAYSMFSGSTKEGYKLGAQSGLFWLAVQTFKSEGLHMLNRGGVPATAEREDDALHGIYRFKRRLGTTPIECRSGEKVISRVKQKLVEIRRHLRARSP